MTDPMPGMDPAAKRYTAKFAALRMGLEATVPQADFNPEGTRRVIQGGAQAEVSVELPGEFDSGLRARVDAPAPAAPAPAPSPAAPEADEAAPQPATPAEAATEPRALARAGRSLEDILARLAAHQSDRLSGMGERVALAVRLCEAVSTVHASGVLLNDLKPALIGVGLFGEISLIDRGSATPLGASGAKVTGTPAYMSPEQARGEVLATGSDIYALGAICYRLFTLRYPLWDTDPDAFWERKRRGDLDAIPESVVEQVPAALLAICRHALAPQPHERYRDAAAMALDLQAFLDGRAVSVHREGLPRRLLRAGRRHRLGLVAGLVIVAMTAGFLHLRHQRHDERERLLRQLTASEAVYGAQVADGLARAAALRRQLDDIQRQRGWRQVVELDFAKPIDPRLQAVQVNETVRIESEAVALLRQAEGVLEILPAPHRTFVRWSEGISEDARIDLEVESPAAKGWNLDVTVAGDPLNGYRLRLFDQDYLCLETINRGWADLLARVPSPPIAGRDRLQISLQHVAGRITASIDGKVLIDYIDPQPLAGPSHRSVAVGRFFTPFAARIRRMTISSRTVGELVGVLDPGIDLLRQGRAGEAGSWFQRVAESPPSEHVRSEARFLAALAEPAGEPRRQALLALAGDPRQDLADRAIFVAIDQAVQEELWGELPGLIARLRGLDKPDLTRRVALNLIGQLQQWRWIDPVRRAGLLAAFAATGHRELQLYRAGLADLSLLGGGAYDDLRLADNDLKDVAPVIGASLRLAWLDGNLLTALPPLAGTAIERLSANRNPLASLAGVQGAKLVELSISETQVADMAPLAGMASLRRLFLSRTQVADLAPLRGLPLESLAVDHTPVHDLAPLAGMPLAYLDASRTQVGSLAPLASCPAKLNLDISGTAIADLAPLHGLQLWRLGISDTAVRSLAPLAGLPLESINLARTGVTDLAPLAGCPLRRIGLAGTAVSELAPLAGCPLREVDLAGHARGSLQPLFGKPLDLLVLPPGPYSGEQLGQFARLVAREVRIDPADPAQWTAAEQIQGVVRINGLLRGAALARRDACRELLAGRSCDLGALTEPQAGLRLVLLPLLVTREEAVALATLAGGRLPCVGDPLRYRQLTMALYHSLSRNHAPIHVGVACAPDGQPVWLDGRAWTDRPLLRDDIARLAAGGTVCFDVNRPYEVQPADTRTVLAIELP